MEKMTNKKLLLKWEQKKRKNCGQRSLSIQIDTHNGAMVDTFRNGLGIKCVSYRVTNTLGLGFCFEEKENEWKILKKKIIQQQPETTAKTAAAIRFGEVSMSIYI